MPPEDASGTLESSPIGAPPPPWSIAGGATAANRFGLDYGAQARRLGAPVVPITDIHIHVNGARASRIYHDVARRFGVVRILTQTRMSEADAVRDALGNMVHFMAVPNWSSPDRGHAFRQGFLDDIPVWRERYGARTLKFWAAPRLWEIVGGNAADCVPLDSPWRVRAAELATSLGMMFMAHIADPDTWFATKYADATVYRAKQEHYLSLERMLDRFPSPWIGAHLGGWPEDLDFLDGLLGRHPNLVLDTSATKWVVRALGAHPASRTREFFIRWKGRILFGSDIVTLEDHLQPRPAGTPPASPMSDLADNPAAAFDLYASRYFALRTMLETSYEGESPIADPDLVMTEPQKYTPMSAPTLRGLALPPDVLRSLYHDVAEGLVFRWIREHP